jgi:hypothetical protein
VVTARKNLLRDLPLPPLANGGPIYPAFATGTNVLETIQPATHNLSVSLVGGSGANAAVTFVVVPVPNGRHESTAAGDAFSFAVTATTTTPLTMMTNLPTWRWPGVQAVRIKTVTNADTDASSGVALLDVSLNGPQF